MKHQIKWIIGVVTICMLATAPARAGLVVSVQSVTVAAGTTGDALDITLSNTGPAPVTVGGFSFGITAANPGITFTEANISTALDAYIFVGNSLFGPIINTSSGQSLVASDFFAVSGFGTTIGVGGSVGLGHVLFDVAGGATTGPSAVTLGPLSTSLSDPSGNTLADTLSNGTITVTGGATAVPEPAMGSMLLIGLMGVAFALRRRRPAS